MNEEQSFWSRLGNVVETGLGGYFDLKVAQTEKEAQRETRLAEEQRASMIDQLSRTYTIGKDTAGEYLSAIPAWVIPAALLGIGGLFLYKYAK